MAGRPAGWLGGIWAWELPGVVVLTSQWVATLCLPDMLALPCPALPYVLPGADMPLTAAAAAQRVQPQLLEATAAALTAAAAHLGVLISGLPKELEEAAKGDGAAS